jgi:hypothetical protein
MWWEKLISNVRLLQALLQRNSIRKFIVIATKATAHNTVLNQTTKLVNIATNIEQQIRECRNSAQLSKNKSN